MANEHQTATRATHLFLSSGFLWRFCTAAYWLLFFIRVVVDIGLSPLELVLVGTVKEVTILAVEIPTGVVADLRSRRLSVVIAFALCGTAIAGAGVADAYPVLLGTQILWALGSTFRSGAETAWYTDEVGSIDFVDSLLPRRARLEAAGSISGVLCSALLAAAFGLTVAIATVGAFLVVWGALLKILMPETGFRPTAASGILQARRIFSAGLTVSRRPALGVLLLVTVLTGFASEPADRLQIARLDQIGFSPDIDVALVMGATASGEALLSILVLVGFGSRLAGRRFVTAAVLLNAITALGVLLLAVSGSVAIALIGVVAAGSSRDIARTVTVGWTNHFTEQHNRATVHSFVGQAMSLGEISGGLILGVVAEQLGLSTALAASSAIYLTASITARLGKVAWHRSQQPVAR